MACKDVLGVVGYGTFFPLSHVPAGGCIILLSIHLRRQFDSVSHSVLARGRVHLLLLRGQRGSLAIVNARVDPSLSVARQKQLLWRIARHVPPQDQA
eukprot:2688697-Pyramimonas_sp.AAC.1